MTDDTPVSWLLIEPGWDVVTADGERVGKVADRIGDSNVDIFDGLSVSLGLVAKKRYVPAEQVGFITNGTVHLKIGAAQLKQDAKYDTPPPSEHILPERASWTQRLRRFFGGT
jgi:hypothetical protein